jgi:hypothetical protein
MTINLHHFARWKNRSRDSSSSSPSQRPWLQGNSHKLNNRTRLYSLLTDSNQRMACPLRDVTFHAKTNPGLVILLTFWGRLSPISLKSFLSQLQELLCKASVSRSMQSKRFSSGSLGYGDSPEGACHICSQRLKRPIGERWQMTRWVSSIVKQIILFLGL